MSTESSTPIHSIEEVASRLVEAATTARRLPPVRVQGYFNLWPTIVRTEYERFAQDETLQYRFPPSPIEIERMMASMQWVQWLEVEQRKLVWMRAERYRWNEIGKRFGCVPRTAQRRWELAIHLICLNLEQRN